MVSPSFVFEQHGTK